MKLIKQMNTKTLTRCHFFINIIQINQIIKVQLFYNFLNKIFSWTEDGVVLKDVYFLSGRWPRVLKGREVGGGTLVWCGVLVTSWLESEMVLAAAVAMAAAAVAAAVALQVTEPWKNSKQGSSETLTHIQKSDNRRRRRSMLRLPLFDACPSPLSLSLALSLSLLLSLAHTNTQAHAHAHTKHARGSPVTHMHALTHVAEKKLEAE